MVSLRGRLLVGIGALVLTTGFLAGGAAFKWSFDEAIELQDSVLVQVGALISSRGRQPPVPFAEAIDAEARITIEELGLEGYGAPARPGLPAGLPDGLQTLAREGEEWRIIVRTRADGSRVAVGQPTALRRETATDSAIRTVLPLIVLVPCLTLLVAMVIDRSLRPLRRVAERLDAGRSTDFDTLPLDGMPSEVRPFVDSINRLLARIGTMVDQKKHFIADAAHELRTPITALSLQVANLGAGELAPQSRARLEALNLGVRRIAHLLEQLLALAHYDTGTTARTSTSSLDAIARESVADLLPLAAARGIDLGFARIEAVVVRAEATALAVLLRNLVGNAVRYTPAGGRIDIDVHREGAGAVVRVSDSGPGIAPGDLDLVFEPFYRGASATEEGSGLGLSIVRRIVDGFGGTITLENKSGPAGCGLVATVRVPAVPSLS